MYIHELKNADGARTSKKRLGRGIGSGTGKTKPINPVLYDLTSLYYLNNVTNAMEYKTSEDAVKALDTLLDM